MIRIFLGYDKRETAGLYTCIQSLQETCSVPFSVTLVSGERRDGTNDFIYSRFLVPYLCGFHGWALFADGSDMLFREDVAKLLDMKSLDLMCPAAHVVKRNYLTRNPQKYVGTNMSAPNEDYRRKNWSSLILWNCAHLRNKVLTPGYVEKATGSYLHQFGWLDEDDGQLAALPPKWNVLIGEDGEDEECAVAHFTLGIPAFPYYANCRYADEWRAVRARSQGAG